MIRLSRDTLWGVSPMSVKLRTHVCELSLAVVLLPLSSCALIDAISGSSSDAGFGDGGLGGADAQQCEEEGVCYRLPSFFNTGLSGVHTLVIDRIDTGTELDVVVASDSGATVFFGDGQGGFTHDNDLVQSVAVSALAVGNFDGDGANDVATFDSENGLQVFFSDGSGTFDVTQVQSVADTSTLLAMDVNGDSSDDLVVEQMGMLVALANMGESSFQMQEPRPLISNYDPSFVAGRFSDDGFEDAAEVTHSGVYVYMGDSFFGFDTVSQQEYEGATAVTAWPAPSDPYDLVAVLFPCDPCNGSPLVEMFNAGSGASIGNFTYGGDPFRTVAGATGTTGLTTNSILLASSHAGADNILVLSDWDESFNDARFFSAGSEFGIAAMAVADLNQDGVDDIVVAYEGNGKLGILLSYPH